jgi:ATP-dependent DNA helicase RecQ
MTITCPKCRGSFTATPFTAGDDAAAVVCPQCGHTYTLDMAAGDRYDPPEGMFEDEAMMPPVGFDEWRDPLEQPPSAASLDSPESVLRQVFGYTSFRDNQKTIIDTLLAGRDAFVLMPTGSGKSLCYQIPSILRRGVGIVISPLIALMQDQVTDLTQAGVRAYGLNSSLSAEEAARVTAIAADGACDLLYVAPERLLTDRFQALLGTMPIALFAIDEAHCVSQWGHDFRPEYLQIERVTRQFPGVPRIALTATADPVTREEIVEKLALTDAERFIASFDRPNIFYRVRIKQSDKQQLLKVIQERHAGHAGIVYVRTRKRADTIAGWLAERGITALPYHAGLDTGTRHRHQRRFLMEEGVVMVATIAFGMGIDKPDVRFVAHLDLPSSMEAYYQETGRAGRDGQSAEAWLFYSLGDVVAMRALLDQSDGSDAFKSIRQRRLGAFLGFCEHTECRRVSLLRYFGETYPGSCGTCDNCTEPVATWDGTIAAQKALSCVYRTGQRFGAVYLIDVLTGKSNPRMERFGHQRIKTFGAGSDLDPKTWHSIFRQLLAAGCLDADLATRSGFRLNEKSWRLLKGEETIAFRKDPRPIRQASSPKAPAIAVEPLTDAASTDLWEALRKLRLEISTELNVPPYVIFHDKTLREMVRQRPDSHAAMLAISGVGQSKLDRFGDRFLAVINDQDENADG